MFMKHSKSSRAIFNVVACHIWHACHVLDIPVLSCCFFNISVKKGFAALLKINLRHRKYVSQMAELFDRCLAVASLFFEDPEAFLA